MSQDQNDNDKNEEKVDEEKDSEVVFLLDAEEKSTKVKGTHVNFAAEEQEEESESSNNSDTLSNNTNQE